MAKIYSFSSKSSHRWQLQLLSIPAHKGALVYMTVPNTEIQHTDIYKQHQKSKKCKDTYQMGLSENSVPKNVMADHHFRCQNTHQIAHPPVFKPKCCVPHTALPGTALPVSATVHVSEASRGRTWKSAVDTTESAKCSLRGKKGW